uniref:Leucine-rich repeat-containing protein 15 n=1 Tax=Schistocephalus solidus TaxID=70667 RepID=A0A0X3NY00_SCHSO
MFPRHRRFDHAVANCLISLVLHFIFHVFPSGGERVNSVCLIQDATCRCLFDKATTTTESLSSLLLSCCKPTVFKIWLHGERLGQLPPNVFYEVPCHNLVDVHISETRVESLPPNGLGFSGLPNLQSLHLTSNRQLVALPEAAFTGLSVSHLNLSGNSLNQVTRDAFLGLNEDSGRLRSLDLSDNQIQYLEPAWFPPRKGSQLRKLELRGNKLEKLHPGMLSGLESLEELDLRHNPLNAIIGGTFSKLSTLRQLLISGPPTGMNQASLERLTPAMFHGLHHLQILTLSRLGVSSIDLESFLELRALRDLDLSGNALEEVPGSALERLSFTQRNRLITLNLADNRITCLPSNGLAKLVRLRRLDLSGNQLTVIGSLAFEGLKALREVNLLDNPLQIIAPDAFLYFSGDGILKIVHEPAGVGQPIPNSDNPTVRLPRYSQVQQNFTSVMMERCPAVSTTKATLQSHRKSSNILIAGWQAGNKISTIIITICLVLVVIVVSATVVSCRGCRKRGAVESSKKSFSHPHHGNHQDLGSGSLVKAYEGLQYQLARDSLFQPSCCPAELPAFNPTQQMCCHMQTVNSCDDEVEYNHCGTREKLKTSRGKRRRKLFTLGQKLAPPPYPHNGPTIQDKLLQTVGSVNISPRLVGACGSLCPASPKVQLAALPTAELPAVTIPVAQKATLGPGGTTSGETSPNLSNLGSSPGFSSSSSVPRTTASPQRYPHHHHRHHHYHQQAEAEDMFPVGKMTGTSPLHESGIASDNNSSLVTALGVL